MDKKKLMKLADSYRKKADAAYQNYQETGATRYCNSYHRNDDLAEALQIAANAADEHNALIAIRGELAHFAFRAAMATSKHRTESEKSELAAALASGIVVYGRMHGFISEKSDAGR